MPNDRTISVTIPGHGTYSCSPADLERAVSLYLVTTPSELRVEISERTGIPFEDVLTWSELLIVLADLDHREL